MGTPWIISGQAEVRAVPRRLAAHPSGCPLNPTDTAILVPDGFTIDGARLRGILFDGAAGSITHNTVTNINQGASGCQEGNGIEVRNGPFDNTGGGFNPQP